MSEKTSGPSDKAVEAARQAWNPDDELPSERQARRALDAAHDPALGLDRSVCLRDVVEAITRAHAPTGDRFRWDRADWADFIEREFGDKS